MGKFYYDRLREQILPRNADVTMIIGARGLGKTYGVRKYFIEDYIRNGYCFVEVARYREECDDVARNYFDRIVSDNLFPDYVFRTTTKTAEIAEKPLSKNDKPDWRICGYFIPLSLQQQKKKSTFVNVRNICMDEIIIDNNDIHHHYLRNEFNQLANLVDTVTRERGDTDNQGLRKPRLFLLGNACDARNPYFQRYDVPLEPSYGLHWLDGKTCLFDYVRDDEYAKAKTAGTVAGRMLKDDSSIASDNRFRTHTDEFILKPHTHPHSSLDCVFRWLRHDYGVILDMKCGYVFITRKFDRAKRVPQYALTRDDNRLNYLTANIAKQFIRNLIDYHSLGLLRYDTVETQLDVSDMLKCFGVK